MFGMASYAPSNKNQSTPHSFLYVHMPVPSVLVRSTSVASRVGASRCFGGDCQGLRPLQGAGARHTAASYPPQAPALVGPRLDDQRQRTSNEHVPHLPVRPEVPPIGSKPYTQSLSGSRKRHETTVRLSASTAPVPSTPTPFPRLLVK